MGAKWLQYFFLFGLWLECLSIITLLLWHLLILTYSAAQLLFLFCSFRTVYRLVFWAAGSTTSILRLCKCIWLWCTHAWSDIFICMAILFLSPSSFPRLSLISPLMMCRQRARLFHMAAFAAVCAHSRVANGSPQSIRGPHCWQANRQSCRHERCIRYER
jgi:hypothetical protein